MKKGTAALEQPGWHSELGKHREGLLQHKDGHVLYICKELSCSSAAGNCVWGSSDFIEDSELRVAEELHMSSQCNIVLDRANTILVRTCRGKVCTYITSVLPSLFANFHDSAPLSKSPHYVFSMTPNSAD